VSPLATSMPMTDSMLLWWTLDSVPLPVVIKPKVVKEASGVQKWGERGDGPGDPKQEAFKE